MDTTKFKSVIFVTLLVSLPLFSVSVRAQTTPVPVYITFDSGNPNSPPETGGVNEPSILQIIPQPNTSGSIEVRESANGIESQVVVLTSVNPVNVSTPGTFLSVSTNINPIANAAMRVEATVAFDRLVDGFFLQTTVPSAVVTRLIVLSSGVVESDDSQLGVPRQTIGSYSPGEPFRVRIDIDLIDQSWSAVIDNELNGFSDDPVVTDLVFSNDQLVISQVGSVGADFSKFPTDASRGTTSVAYDDISISVNGITVVPLDVTDKQINICNKTPIKAAALGRPFYSATHIDPATMMFADAPIKTVGKNEKPLAQVKDTNHDGNPDLEGRFISDDLSLDSQSEFGIFEAKTVDGDSVEGLDAVSVRAFICPRSAANAFFQ